METMNQLLVTLIIILLPGIVAAIICDKIAVHSKWTPFKFGLYSLVLGVFSYLSLQVIFYVENIISSCKIFPIEWQHLKIWSAALAEKPSIPANEVAWSVALSIPVAFFASFLVNHKVFNKLAKFLNVSQKYGDENLFSHYLNAKEIDWIYVRDIENKLTYQGRIYAYSETENIQEIVMSEVTVYSYEESEELYSVPTIYLNKQMGKFIIEAIPACLLGEENDREKTT